MDLIANSSVFAAAVDALKFPPTSFPKGKPIQKNLDTHYVNLEALFSSLAREGFGGSVVMVFEEGTEALIVFREGTIITAYAFGDDGKKTGLPALSHALVLAKDSRAYVDVFKLEHEILVALLPLLHGVQVPVEAAARSLDERLAGFKKAEFVGAIVVGEQVPETVGLIYAGVPMGWYDAQGVELETGSTAPPVKSLTVRAFALENADTFAAINLALDKVQVAARIRGVLEGELKELGLVLYARGMAKQEVDDEARASKGQFLALAEDVERSLTILRGPAAARRLGADLRRVLDGMLDVGF
ncbi:MAG: hypothetical protein AAB152_15020 [Candidatus Coatesbacteria bacterium]